MRSLESSAIASFSRPAYSRAAAGSWMEQGPTTTTRRSSDPLRMFTIWWRASKTVREALSVTGISSSRKTGGITTLLDLILRLFVGYAIAVYQNTRYYSMARPLAYVIFVKVRVSLSEDRLTVGRKQSLVDVPPDFCKPG